MRRRAIKRAMRRLLLDDAGQGTIEYILIIGVLVVVLMNLVMLFRDYIFQTIDRVNDQLDYLAEQQNLLASTVHEGGLPKCSSDFSPVACDP